jgi:reverse gyrase
MVTYLQNSGIARRLQLFGKEKGLSFVVVVVEIA